MTRQQSIKWKWSIMGHQTSRVSTFYDSTVSIPPCQIIDWASSIYMPTISQLAFWHQNIGGYTKLRSLAYPATLTRDNLWYWQDCACMSLGDTHRDREREGSGCNTHLLPGSADHTSHCNRNLQPRKKTKENNVSGLDWTLVGDVQIISLLPHATRSELTLNTRC